MSTTAYGGYTLRPMKHCCAHSATIWKTLFSRYLPMDRTAALPTGNSSWASGTIRCPMHCSLPRKKVSLPPTSMPNWSASTPITSPCSAQQAGSGRRGAAPKCARTARRFSGKRVCGSASKSPIGTGAPLRRSRRHAAPSKPGRGAGEPRPNALVLLAGFPASASVGAHRKVRSELERLYADHVAMQRPASRVGAPGSRAQMRSYCSQVFRQARLWERIEKSVRASEFTFPGDPMRIDYSYRRNGTRGFVHCISVTRAPNDSKILAYTAERITTKAALKTEFAAVTDVALDGGNDRHCFVRDTLRDVGIEPVAMEGFAVWVAKLIPLLQ